MTDIKSVVQRQFGRRAEAYAQSPSHAADIDLSLLLRRLSLRADDHLLDVATGTGFTALALQSSVKVTVGLDLTREMLLEAARLAGMGSPITWVQGDAEALPFVDRSFTVVTCRRSAHHFPHLDRALEEMYRVLQPGGRLGIVDQASPDGTTGRALMEQLERLRDPSHVRGLTPARWRELVHAHGFSVPVAEVLETRLASFDEWLDRAGVDADRRTTIGATLAHASATAHTQIGYEGGASPTFVRRWIVLVGERLDRRE